MTSLPDLIYTALVDTLQDSGNCMDDRQAHAVCLTLSRIFSPDRPDSITAGRQLERQRTMALIALRLEHLQLQPSQRKQAEELINLRRAILEADT